MQERPVGSLDGEDSLEEEIAPHSRILAWKIPWTEEPGRLQPMGSQSRTHLRDFHFCNYRPRSTWTQWKLKEARKNSSWRLQGSTALEAL